MGAVRIDIHFSLLNLKLIVHNPDQLHWFGRPNKTWYYILFCTFSRECTYIPLDFMYCIVWYSQIGSHTKKMLTNDWSQVRCSYYMGNWAPHQIYQQVTSWAITGMISVAWKNSIKFFNGRINYTESIFYLKGLYI